MITLHSQEECFNAFLLVVIHCLIFKVVNLMFYADYFFSCEAASCEVQVFLQRWLPSNRKNVMFSEKLYLFKCARATTHIHTCALAQMDHGAEPFLGSHVVVREKIRCGK